MVSVEGQLVAIRRDTDMTEQITPDGTMERATDVVHVKIVEVTTMPRDARTWAKVDKMRPLAEGGWYFFGVPEWTPLECVTLF
jgi:hypothetical protein